MTIFKLITKTFAIFLSSVIELYPFFIFLQTIKPFSGNYCSSSVAKNTRIKFIPSSGISLECMCHDVAAGWVKLYQYTFIHFL